MNSPAQNSTPARRENPLVSLLFNIVIPVVILMRFSSDEWLGPVNGLLVALAFPLAYGIFDYSQRRTLNFLPIVGVVGILLTGGIGLLKLDPKWIAVKEGAIPLCIGIAVIGSLKTRFSLVSVLLNKVIDSAAVNAALDERGTRAPYKRRLVHATFIVAASFFLSSVSNYPSGAPGGGESAWDNSLQRGVGQDDGPEFPRDLSSRNHHSYNSHSLHRRRHS